MEWYAEKARAMARYTTAQPPQTDAMSAILTELALDAGNRAALARLPARALAEQQALNECAALLKRFSKDTMMRRDILAEACSALAALDAARETPPVVHHGADCREALHHPVGGYLHSAGDDSAYDVDGVKYCGRCHQILAAARREGEKGRQP